MQPMHIVYSSDDNYAQHMGASIYSLLSHNAGSAIVIYVIDNGIYWKYASCGCFPLLISGL